MTFTGLIWCGRFDSKREGGSSKRLALCKQNLIYQSLCRLPQETFTSALISYTSFFVCNSLEHRSILCKELYSKLAWVSSTSFGLTKLVTRSGICESKCVCLSVCLGRDVLWRNGASYRKTYYWQPIGSGILGIDWYQTEWPWPLFRGHFRSCQQFVNDYATRSGITH